MKRLNYLFLCSIAAMTLSFAMEDEDNDPGNGGVLLTSAQARAKDAARLPEEIADWTAEYDLGSGHTLKHEPTKVDYDGKQRSSDSICFAAGSEFGDNTLKDLLVVKVVTSKELFEDALKKANVKFTVVKAEENDKGKEEE